MLRVILATSQRLAVYTGGDIKCLKKGERSTLSSITQPGNFHPCSSYLEARVLVDGAPSELGHHRQCSHVHILVREEEEVDTAALGHTLSGQALIGTCLRLKQRLGGREYIVGVGMGVGLRSKDGRGPGSVHSTTWSRAPSRATPEHKANCSPSHITRCGPTSFPSKKKKKKAKEHISMSQHI